MAANGKVGKGKTSLKGRNRREMCRIEPKSKQDGGGRRNPRQKDYGYIVSSRKNGEQHQMTVAIHKSTSNPLS